MIQHMPFGLGRVNSLVNKGIRIRLKTKKLFFFFYSSQELYFAVYFPVMSVEQLSRLTPIFSEGLANLFDGIVFHGLRACIIKPRLLCIIYWNVL